MAILNAKTEIVGRRARLYAGPKFARHAGRWHTIDDLIRVTRQADTYIVALGDERITMSPAGEVDRVALAAATHEDIITPTHFGPTLDANRMTVNRISWRLDWTGGVQADADGLSFRGVEGVNLGVFFADWRRNLKDDCTIDLAAKTIDLRLARAIDYARASDIRLNLDPETVLVTDQAAGFCYHSREHEAPGTWVTQQAAGSSLSTNPVIATIAFDDCYVTIGRTALQFDLSAFGSPLTAYLYLYRSGAVGSEIRLRGAVNGFTSPLTTAANYGTIASGTAVGGNWATPAFDWLKSPEIVSVLGSHDSYDLGVMHSLDTPTPPASGMAGCVYTSAGANAGYLEITLPAADPAMGGTSTSTGTTRRHGGRGRW